METIFIMPWPKPEQDDWILWLQRKYRGDYTGEEEEGEGRRSRKKSGEGSPYKATTTQEKGKYMSTQKLVHECSQRHYS